jgi:hypothetical protein
MKDVGIALMSGERRRRAPHLDDLHFAAASSTDCPDERLISTFPTLPSLLIDTVKSRLP